MVSKNAQAALEFLTSYGWALFGVIIIIGAIYYFDYDPASYLRNQCSFGSQLDCVEYRVFENGRVDLLIRNNFARPISIKNVIVLDSNGNVAMVTTPVYIGSGRTNMTSFMLPAAISTGRQELLLAINFSRADTTGPNHLVAGRIYSTVLKGGPIAPLPLVPGGVYVCGAPDPSCIFQAAILQNRFRLHCQRANADIFNIYGMSSPQFTNPWNPTTDCIINNPGINHFVNCLSAPGMWAGVSGPVTLNFTLSYSLVGNPTLNNCSIILNGNI